MSDNHIRRRRFPVSRRSTSRVLNRRNTPVSVNRRSSKKYRDVDKVLERCKSEPCVLKVGFIQFDDNDDDDDRSDVKVPSSLEILFQSQTCSDIFVSPDFLSSVSPQSFQSEAPAPTLLLLCGKSNEEKDVARILKENNTLQLHKNGEQVEVVLHSQVETLNDEFRVEEYFYSLSTRRFGRLLIYSPKLSSTHDVISQNNSDLPVGSVCVADVQLKGRGRTSNVWQSPKGCLVFSFLIQMEDGRMVPHLQYVVCLAMTEAIKAICPHLDVRIKWPNDLYLGGLKVGGILSTSVYRSKKFYISAGVGLNVGNEKPTTCLNAVLKRVDPLSRELKREEIIAAFFKKFESFYDVFLEQGFQALEELYYRTWLHSGQRVIVQERSDDDQDQFVENVVTIQGLTSSGYLLAITDDGQMCELHPDGNSFDFFKGLIKRKMS
ncbi:biotin-protein ligase 1, chloroplastic [Capsicum galapagoense]